MRPVLSPALVENFLPQGLKALVQQGVAGLVEDQGRALAGFEKETIHSPTKKHSGLDGVDVAECLNGLGQVRFDLPEGCGDLEENALDFSVFLGRSLREVVVEINDGERLDEGGNPGAGAVENQTWELGPS